MSSWRTVNESAAAMAHVGRSIRQHERRRRHHVKSSLKGTVTGGAMVGCDQAVAAELEEVVNLAVAGEEPLGMPRRLEPLHLSFSPSRRLVRDFSLVVEVTALSMFAPGQDLPLGGTIAAQLVRHDL